MRQRNLARLWYRAAADQARLRTVWCGDLKGRSTIRPDFPVSPATEWIFVISRASSNSSGGKNGRAAVSPASSFRSRRADKKNVVAAGAGHLESTFCSRLAADFGKIDAIFVSGRFELGNIELEAAETVASLPDWRSCASRAADRRSGTG